MPHVRRAGGRKRQPAGSDLSDAVGDRWAVGAKSPGAAALGVVPRLPRLRDGLSVGRAIWPANRALSRGNGAARRGGEEIRGLVSPLDSVRPVSLSKAVAPGALAGARGARSWFDL